MTNTLAYCCKDLIMVGERVMMQAPGDEKSSFSLQTNMDLKIENRRRVVGVNHLKRISHFQTFLPISNGIHKTLFGITYVQS